MVEVEDSESVQVCQQMEGSGFSTWIPNCSYKQSNSLTLYRDYWAHEQSSPTLHLGHQENPRCPASCLSYSQPSTSCQGASCSLSPEKWLVLASSTVLPVNCKIEQRPGGSLTGYIKSAFPLEIIVQIPSGFTNASPQSPTAARALDVSHHPQTTRHKPCCDPIFLPLHPPKPASAFCGTHGVSSETPFLLSHSSLSLLFFSFMSHLKPGFS